MEGTRIRLGHGKITLLFDTFLLVRSGTWNSFFCLGAIHFLHKIGRILSVKLIWRRETGGLRIVEQFWSSCCGKWIIQTLCLWAALVFFLDIGNQESAVTPLRHHYVIFSSTCQQYKWRQSQSSPSFARVLCPRSFFNLLSTQISRASASPFCHTCQDFFSFIHSFTQ